MGSRLDLHAALLSVSGLENAYYQPPESVRLVYPCIIYSRDGKAEQFANDKLYTGTYRYTVTVVDTDPDSTIPDAIAKHIPLTSYDRRFVSDGLYHDVFQIYY